MNYAIDIGGNRGLWTDANLHKFDKIICVEANLGLVDFLKRKYQGNDKVEILNYAVTDKNGPVTFNVCREADTISSCSSEWVNESRFSQDYSWFPVTVEGITVDSLLERYGLPNLVKIDTEGNEESVVRGLSQNVPLVLMEWAEESKDKILLTVERLKTIGFTEFAYCECDPYNWIPDNWNSWENLGLEEQLNIERKSLWGMLAAR